MCVCVWGGGGSAVHACQVIYNDQSEVLGGGVWGGGTRSE